MASTDRDLVEWLRTQLDAHEAEARTLLNDAQEFRQTLKETRLLGTEQVGHYRWADVERMAAATLADIEAKRRIVDAVERYASWEPHPGQPCTNDEEHGGDPYEPCELHVAAMEHQPPQVDPYVLRLLASAYAHRPGCREEWRPA